ncbi:MAG TPA: GIY-YIG nuclease family protein, partial [Caulobacteraceae bacterium]|nr:GIY-YIG nuclease family protein [Caulobacteraceae bacterium]
MNGKKDIDPASEDLREDDLREDEDAGLPELELEEAAAGTLAAGRAAIARYAKLAPKAPGVYRMFDAKGDVLYVGKAKNIRKRVLNYARPTAYDARIARMIAATVTMEFVTTKTETEALLLEANLIKRLRPRFNVLLRDDKSFPEIVIRREHPAAQLRKHRGAHTIKGDYF